MRTEQIKIFQFQELSKDAQERAHRTYLYSDHFEYHWLQEELQELRDWLNLAGIEIIDYSLATYGHSYINTDLDQEDCRGIKADHFDDFKATFCNAEEFTKEFKKFIGENSGDVKGAIEHVVNKAMEWIILGMEGQESLEYFREHCATNDCEFLENGDWY